MQFGLNAVAAGLALAAASTMAAPVGAATMRFSGGATTPPTDLPSYLRHVYCERVGPGAAASDRGCRAIVDWMARNAGRAPAAWSPPPVIR